MTIYLTIITTVLVLTQIVRIAQNHKQLKKLYKTYEAELNAVSQRDIETQKEFYELGIIYLAEKIKELNNEQNLYEWR